MVARLGDGAAQAPQCVTINGVFLAKKGEVLWEPLKAGAAVPTDRLLVSLFETVGLTEDHIFLVGDTAAVKWTGQGRGRNGKNVSFEGIDVIECNSEGEIVLGHAYWNPAPVVAAVTS